MLNEFKKFIMRGNVVDLAVAVLLGAAFGGIATALTKNIITPLIAAIFGDKTNFANLSFEIHKSVFNYGEVINAFVSFFLIAIVVFFFIVQPMNKLSGISKRGKDIEPLEKECPECLSNIPIKARRCAYCTTKLPESS